MPDTSKQDTRKPNRNKVEYVKYNTSGLIKFVSDAYKGATEKKKK
jgi:hypothetical protein